MSKRSKAVLPWLICVFLLFFVAWVRHSRLDQAGSLQARARSFADQPYNARAVEDAGAGVAVLRPEAAPFRTAIQRVLNDSSLRAGAGRIADEMSTMATMDDAAGALLALAHARTS